MTKDKRFNDFIERLLKYEGGYVNDPSDPGGETNFGISKRSYPELDIRNLTKNQAGEIYFRDYYQRMEIARFVNDRIAWQVFDFGVNAGCARSALTLQKIVGAWPDGVIGVKTISKADTYSGVTPLHIVFIAERVKHYLSLCEKKESNHRFLKGWILRAIEL
ncbi:MAG: peptidoglycan-binding protein [Ignavibacteria bacterium]|nr:peptidoglycan-binding protein [Ignavibacteria bacterium]